MMAKDGAEEAARTKEKGGRESVDLPAKMHVTGAQPAECSPAREDTDRHWHLLEGTAARIYSPLPLVVLWL